MQKNFFSCVLCNQNSMHHNIGCCVKKKWTANITNEDKDRIVHRLNDYFAIHRLMMFYVVSSHTFMLFMCMMMMMMMMMRSNTSSFEFSFFWKIIFMFRFFSLCIHTMPRRMKTIIVITGQTLPNKNSLIFYNDQQQRSIKQQVVCRFLCRIYFFWYFNVGQWSALSCLKIFVCASCWLLFVIMRDFDFISLLFMLFFRWCSWWCVLKIHKKKHEKWFDERRKLLLQKIFFLLLKKSIDSLLSSLFSPHFDTCRR